MRIVLILQNIPDKIVVFIKRREVIMPAAMDADQGDFTRIDL